MEIRFQVPRVLYVDPDEENRQAFEYALVGHAKVWIAQTPEEALRLLKNDPEIAVVVTEFHLGQMSGVQFLQEAHKVLPGTVNLLVTAGLDDASLLAQAVNSGLVWRVYDKTSGEYLAFDNLAKIVDEAAKEQARRQVKMVLAWAMLEVVRALAQRHEQVQSENGRVARREHLAQMLGPYLDLTALELELLPAATLIYGLEPAVRDARVRELLGDISADVAALRPLAHALEDIHARFDGTGTSGTRGTDIAALARVLAVVDCFDQFMAVKIADGSSVTDAIAQATAALQSEAGKWFDPLVVTVLTQMVRENPSAVAGLYYRQAN